MGEPGRLDCIRLAAAVSYAAAVSASAVYSEHNARVIRNSSSWEVILDLAKSGNQFVYKAAVDTMNIVSFRLKTLERPPPFRMGRAMLSAKAEDVLTWTLWEVGTWARTQPFAALAPQFEAAMIDGPVLVRDLTLVCRSLQRQVGLNHSDLEELGIKKSVQRKVILSAIARLVFAVERPDEIEAFLAFQSQGLAGPVTSVTSAPAAPRPSSLPALGKRQSLVPKAIGAPAVSRPQMEGFDVFISYRRSDGSAAAQLVKATLTSRNLKCFLDVDNLKGGDFEEDLRTNLSKARNIVCVMTNEYTGRMQLSKVRQSARCCSADRFRTPRSQPSTSSAWRSS